MGEAKRRKQLDPNFGKPRKLTHSEIAIGQDNGLKAAKSLAQAFDGEVVEVAA